MKFAWMDFKAGLLAGLRYGTELGIKAFVVSAAVAWGMIRVLNAAGPMLGGGK